MTSSELNPFKINAPVEPQHFYGREEELRIIFKNIKRAHSTFIYGSPRIGKSSLLLKLYDSSTRRQQLGTEDDKIIFMFIDGHSLPVGFTTQNFFERMDSHLSEEYGHSTVNKKVPLAQLRETIAESFNLGELNELIFDLDIDLETSRLAPKTEKVPELISYFQRRKELKILFDKLKQTRPNVKWPHEEEFDSAQQPIDETVAFKKVTQDQVLKRLAKSGKKIVILIDELDYLIHHDQLSKERFFLLLRNLVSISEYRHQLVAIGASRHNPTSLFHKHDHGGSPPFNTYYPLQLSSFTDDQSESLLLSSDHQFKSKEINFICRATGNHPYLLQHLAHIFYHLKPSNDLDDIYLEFSKATNLFFQEVWDHFKTNRNMHRTIVVLALFELLLNDFGYYHSENILNSEMFGQNIDAKELKLRLNNFNDKETNYVPEYLRVIDLESWKFEINEHTFQDSSSDIRQWTISQQSFSWWLFNSLIRHPQNELMAKWLANFEKSQDSISNIDEMNHIMYTLRTRQPREHAGALDFIHRLYSRLK